MSLARTLVLRLPQRLPAWLHTATPKAPPGVRWRVGRGGRLVCDQYGEPLADLLSETRATRLDVLDLARLVGVEGVEDEFLALTQAHHADLSLSIDGIEFDLSSPLDRSLARLQVSIVRRALNDAMVARAS